MDTPLVRAVTVLLDVMSHDEREAVAARLATFRVAPLPNGSDLLRYVGGLFTPGATLVVEDIVAAVARHDPSASRKQVYNALGYLSRRGAIRRVQQGRYTAISVHTPASGALKIEEADRACE